MECLYRYYSYGLETSFRRGPFEDFQKFVLEDYQKGRSTIVILGSSSLL